MWTTVDRKYFLSDWDNDTESHKRVVAVFERGVDSPFFLQRCGVGKNNVIFEVQHSPLGGVEEIERIQDRGESENGGISIPRFCRFDKFATIQAEESADSMEIPVYGDEERWQNLVIVDFPLRCPEPGGWRGLHGWRPIPLRHG